MTFMKDPQLIADKYFDKSLEEFRKLTDGEKLRHRRSVTLN